jgi:hypothetical protein
VVETSFVDAVIRWVGSRVSVGKSKLCHITMPLEFFMTRFPVSRS